MILFFSYDMNEVYTTAAEELPRQNSPVRIIVFCILIFLLLLYCFVYDYKSKVKKGKAYAKINLFLNILDKRDDGYHNLRSIFDFINLYDEISIRKSKWFKLICSDKSLENENNIIYKTFLVLKKKYPKIQGVKVVLKKHIPVQAGLGGGSADAATFIDLMRQLYDLTISARDIKEIASLIGADVLPCYYQKTALVEGFGDEVKLLKNKLNYYVVVIKPKMDCSTKKMYELLDKKKRVNKKSVPKIINILEKGTVKDLSKYLYNDFEKVVKVKEIKDDLLFCGALNSLMSGSGSSVFGIFDNLEDAKMAAENLGVKYECYLCNNIKSNS